MEARIAQAFSGGEEVCIICLRTYSDKSKCPSKTSLLHSQSVFDTVAQYLNSEIFSKCFEWNFMREGTSPVCSECLGPMERIYKLDKQLKKLETVIKLLINSFTSEVLGHHNSLEAFYTNNDVESNDSDCLVKAEPFVASVIDIKEECPDFEVEEVEVDLNLNNTITVEENYACEEDYFDDFESNALDSFLSDGENLQSPNDSGIRNTEKTVTNRTPEETTDVTNYRHFKLKPLRIALKKSDSAINSSSLKNDCVSYGNIKLKQLRVSISRLKMDKNGNIISPVRQLNQRSAGLKAKVAMKTIAEKVLNIGGPNNDEFGRTNSDSGWISESEEREKESASGCESDRERIINKTKYKTITRYQKGKRFLCRDRSCHLSFNFSKELESHSLISGHLNEKHYKCKTCSKSFHRSVDCKIHANSHKKVKLFKCSRCLKKFKQKEALRMHNYRRHWKSGTECKQCDRIFLRKTNYEQHIKHHNKKGFKCKICSQQFLWRISLKEHHRIKHEERRHTCTLCNKAFSSLSAANLHRINHFKNRNKKQFPCAACKKIHTVEKIWDDCILRTFRTGRKFKLICAVCMQVFKSTKDLDFHRTKTKHKNIKHFKCTLCKKRFYRTRDIQDHARQHASSKKFKCNICSKKYYRKYDLTSHMKVHDPHHKVLSCTECWKEFKYEHNLREHMNVHSGNKPFECNMCKAAFHTKSQLYKHSKYCTKESTTHTFECKHCDSIFRNENKCKKHEKTHIVGNIFPCKYCGKPITDKLYKRHIETHSAQQHKCSQCKAAFHTLDKLELHKSTAHGSEKPFPCSVCKKAFGSKRSIRKHMEIHSTEKHVCEVCGKAFKKRDDFNAHKKFHTRGFLPCAYCDKKFMTKGSVRQHISIVHSKEVHSCDICEKTFPQAKKLEVHYRSHTGERPFLCDQCPKSYGTKRHLNVHRERTHFSKEVDCKVCGKRLPNKISLEHHARVHGDKKFQCELCGFSCNRKINLTTHIRKHTQEKPYLCTLCGKSFTRSDNLNTHIKWHNKNK